MINGVLLITFNIIGIMTGIELFIHTILNEIVDLLNNFH